MYAKGSHPPPRQLDHLPLGLFLKGINDRRAGENILVQFNHVEHVAVIETVEAHLNEIDALHAVGPSVLEQLRGCERPGAHAGGVKPAASG